MVVLMYLWPKTICKVLIGILWFVHVIIILCDLFDEHSVRVV